MVLTWPLVFALQSTNFDLEFVHINCQSLAASVKDEALGWVQALSQCMRELDTQALEVSHAASLSQCCFDMPMLIISCSNSL